MNWTNSGRFSVGPPKKDQLLIKSGEIWVKSHNMKQNKNHETNIKEQLKNNGILNKPVTTDVISLQMRRKETAANCA